MSLIHDFDKRSNQVSPSLAHDYRCADDGALPFWLEVGGSHIFAWYHPPLGEQKQRQGVLLCNTFGSEGMLLHPAYRHCAQQWARAGYPCLRFDYPATGDSDGHPRDPQLLQSWLDSIHAAVDYLKHVAGIEEVNLFGVLLGASLATVVAQERQDICGLILWAPYLSGKNFLRAAKMQDSVIAANAETRRCREWQEGDTEAFGFLITKEFADDLQRIDLKNISKDPARRACVFVRDVGTTEAKLVNILTESGVAVTFKDQALSDINEILRKLELPHAIIQEVASWLQKDSESKSSSESQEHRHALGPVIEQGQVEQASNSRDMHPCPRIDNCEPKIKQRAEFIGKSGERWFESNVFIGTEAGLFGVLSAPVDATLGNHIAVILINGGANHRVGINRNYTEWSRGWVARGFTVLRLDIRGLGDSPARSGEQRNTLYLDSTLQDIEESVQYLKAHAGVKHIVLVGLCAGAYQSLRYAMEHKNLSGLVLINPLRFQKPRRVEEGLKTSNSYQQFLTTLSLSSYVYFFLNYKNWPDIRRWRRRSVSLLKSGAEEFFRVCASPFTKLSHKTGGSKRLEYPKDILVKQFQELTHNKIRVLLLCSADETILPLVKVALSKKIKSLRQTNYFEYQEISNTNHILTPLWSQERTFEIISDHLDQVLNSIKVPVA